MPQTAMSCQVILFDLDGVLVDSMSLIERILRQWAAGHGLDEEEAVRLSHGRRDIDVVRLIAPHLNAEAETRRIIEVEEHDFRGLTALPGAARLLDSLPPEAWGVVTSGTRMVARGRLAAAGLPLPTHLVAADDIGHGKPDPEGYLTAAGLLGVKPAQCIVVEDAPAGVQAAQAAGMRCIGTGEALASESVLTAHVKDLGSVSAERRLGGLQVTTNSADLSDAI